MIRKESKYYEVEELIGDLEDIDCKIDTSSQNKLFQLLSKGLYKQPIEAICRELTSNCFDSHIEAGVTKPVNIIFDEDENGEYITFKDEGVGLSPQRFDKVYRSYLKSTKENTNDQIGNFGLGSKTPFSYTNTYYIITNYNKVKYVYQGTMSDRPRYSLLLEEDTEECNGTEIKIYFNEYRDSEKFNQALKSQLLYFDEIIYTYNIGSIYGYDRIDNNYSIIEGNIFKFNKTSEVYDSLHIILGKVAYPIDWRIIDKPLKDLLLKNLKIKNIDVLNFPIKVGVGLKFDIGELMVTPSREEIVYDDESINLVCQKIFDCLLELIELYNKNKIYEDYFEWEKKHKAFKSKYYYANDWDAIIISNDININLSNIKYILEPPTWKLLENYEINKTIELTDIFSLSSIQYEYPRKKRETKSLKEVLIKTNLGTHKLIYSKSHNTETKLKNYYLNNYHILNFKPLYTTDRLEIINKLFPKNTLGKAVKYKEIKKLIIDYVFTKYKVIDYDELIIPDNWLENYKNSKKKSVLTIDKNIEITVRDLMHDYQKIIKLTEVCKYNSLLIYCFKDSDSSYYEVIYNLFRLTRKSQNRNSTYANYNFYRVSRDTEKQLKKLRINNNKNIFEISEFMENYNNITGKLFMQLLIDNNKLITWVLDNQNEIKNIVPFLNKEIEHIKQFWAKHRGNYNRLNLANDVSEEMLKLAKEHNLFYPPIYNNYLKITKYFEGIEDLIVNLNSTETIVKLLKKFDKRVSWKYYADNAKEKLKQRDSWKEQLKPFQLYDNSKNFPIDKGVFPSKQISWL